jgi:eukaryotic-like serine/threonine-protein kinase
VSAAIDRLAGALADRYRIERELGAGGMATVYLAHDLRHDRKVALKVLKPELAAVLGAERFVVEIKTTAALQHPHILPLFDSGTADGFLYYVMPFIDGETLRSKLDRETQLGIDETVRITVSVADALDYAHRHGVIHRDIKPENILLHDGRPIVADFGIALAVSAAAGGRMTETGLSLGTPHYMSPEQATAEKEITARSDVYSLGSVLYEMLTGSPPHTGASAQQIIMKIVTEEAAPVTKLRRAVPPNVAAAVATALEKLPADRFESARAFADALSNPAHTRLMRHSATGAPTSAQRWRRAALAAGAALVACSAVAVWALGRSGPPRATPLRHWNLALPDSAPLDYFAPSLYGEGQPALAIAPGADRIAYVARRGGTSALVYRRLDEGDGHLLAGTEGASQPFFSPDGEWIGFFAGGALKKVAIAGGSPVVITRVGAPRGAVWTTDGQILFADRDAFTLQSVPASGGAPSNRISAPDRLYWPSLLPGEEWVVGSSDSRRLVLWSLRDGRGLVVGASDLVPVESSDTASLLTGTYPRYVASGHLVYLVGNTLMALPFDAQRLRVMGPPAPVMQTVRREGWDGAGQYDVAADGTLLFAAGADAARSIPVWVERSGRAADSLPVPPADYYNIFVSGDGRRVALTSYQPTGEQTLSILDIDRGILQELRLGVPARFGTWWPGGRRAVITLRPGREGGSVWRISTDGTGSRDSLFGQGWVVTDVMKDSSYFSIRRYGDTVGTYLMSRDGLKRTFLGLGSAWAVFSPDGRWLAYSGPEGLKVAPVSSTGAAQTVAPDGADEPEWSPRGDELYYRDGPRWMAMTVSTSGGLTVSKPRILFEGRYLNVRDKSYDVGPDGRFLLLVGPPEETARHLDVVTGFAAELRRRAPRGGK